MLVRCLCELNLESLWGQRPKNVFSAFQIVLSWTCSLGQTQHCVSGCEPGSRPSVIAAGWLQRWQDKAPFRDGVGALAAVPPLHWGRVPRAGGRAVSFPSGARCASEMGVPLRPMSWLAPWVTRSARAEAGWPVPTLARPSHSLIHR